jgi:hypothetical protein
MNKRILVVGSLLNAWLGPRGPSLGGRCSRKLR